MTDKRELNKPIAERYLNEDKRLGEVIKQRRKALKISQTNLGDQMGITYQQIQKYESGTNKVSPRKLLQIADVLGVPKSFFDRDSHNEFTEGFNLADPQAVEAWKFLLDYPEMKDHVVGMVLQMKKAKG